MGEIQILKEKIICIGKRNKIIYELNIFNYIKFEKCSSNP